MAADYAGTSNVNLLRPLGQFGSRHKHQAASAAYPKTSLNDPIQELLYRARGRSDSHTHCGGGARDRATALLSRGGHAPRVGVQGHRDGVVDGCAAAHHPVAIVDATLAYLKEGDELCEYDIPPWYRGFGGEIRRRDAALHPPDGSGGGDDDGGGGDDDAAAATGIKNIKKKSRPSSYLVRGAYHWDGGDVHVTEVPPHREVEAYKEDWIKADIASEVYAGVNNVDESVHIVLKKCILTRDEDITGKLGLERNVSYNNMHLLNGSGTLTRYDNIWEIIRDHASLRLDAYRRRIAHDVTVLERKVLIARNRAAFIHKHITRELDLREYADDEEAGRRLVEAGMDAVDGGYDYLLDMKMRSLTVKRHTELQHETRRLETELEARRSSLPESEWETELMALRAALVADARYA